MDIGLIIEFSIAFIICVLITRAIFSIPEIVRMQRAQTLLLSKIASNSHKSEVNEILLNAGFKYKFDLQEKDNKQKSISPKIEIIERIANSDELYTIENDKIISKVKLHIGTKKYQPYTLIKDSPIELKENKKFNVSISEDIFTIIN